MPLSLIHDGEATSDVKEQESKKVRTAILGNSLRTDCFTYISSSGIDFTRALAMQGLNFHHSCTAFVTIPHTSKAYGYFARVGTNRRQ